MESSNSLKEQCVKRYPKGALYIPLKSDGTPMSTVVFSDGIAENIYSDFIFGNNVGYMHAKGRYATILKKKTNFLERFFLKKFVFKYNDYQIKKNHGKRKGKS